MDGCMTATRHGHLQSDENTCVSASLERFFTLAGLLQRRV